MASTSGRGSAQSREPSAGSPHRSTTSSPEQCAPKRKRSKNSHDLDAAAMDKTASSPAANKKMKPNEQHPGVRAPNLHLYQELKRQEDTLIGPKPPRNPGKAAVKFDSSPDTECTAIPRVIVPQPNLDQLPTFDEFQDELRRSLQARVAQLEHDRKTAQQDRLLDSIVLRDKHEKAIRSLKRQMSTMQHHAEHKLAEREKELCEVQGNLQAARDDVKAAQDKLGSSVNKYLTSQSELRWSEEQALRFETLYNNLRDDLDDLRRLENEDVARRQKEALGLPPAYLNRLNPSLQPPYLKHQDGATFSLDATKQIIDNDFNEDLEIYRGLYVTSRTQKDEKIKMDAEKNFFILISRTFVEACRKLQNVTHSRPDHAASIADYTLKLSWSTVSACELRPAVMFSFDPDEKTEMAMIYQEMDETLMGMLQKVLKVEGRDEVLTAYECQKYLTQVKAVRVSFEATMVDIGSYFFTQTINWLEEQTEFERQNQGNGRARPPRD